MEILVNCPGCGRSLKAPSEAAGRQIRCPACGRMFPFVAGAAQGAATPQPTAAQAASATEAPVYGDEVYQPGFSLQTVDPALLKAWTNWRPTSFSTAGAIILDIVTCGLFGLIFYGLKFGEIPKASRNDFGAGKAIGFYFIPYYNFYWIFRFWYGLCDRINLQLRLHERKDLLLPRNLASTMCILTLCGGVVGSFFWIPYAGFLFSCVNMCIGVAQIVLRAILIGKLQTAINTMAAQPAALA